MKFYLKQYKSRVGNAAISLAQPISIQSLIGDIKNELSRRHAEPLLDYSELYFWDLGKKASEFIRTGDHLYIITQDTVYHGTIEVVISDRQGGIGDAIGWARQYRRPWENPVGIRDLRLSPITPDFRVKIGDSLTRATHVAPNFYLLQNQLFKISEFNQNNEVQLGAQEEMITDKDLHGGSDPMEERISKTHPELQEQASSTTVDSQLLDLQDRVIVLQDAREHSEREHESLVERFFEYLGYHSPLDIKYRVGHIDVLINPNSRNSMVVEVKRAWNLTRSNSDVLDQAYRYANKKGSRFVIITNGNYYAFYDRFRGYSIDENFDFDLTILSIDDNDLQLLEKYRKLSLEGS